MVGVAALALTVSLGGREALATAQNRIDLARASWKAEDCLERARAVIGDALSAAAADPGNTEDPWKALDRLVPDAPLLSAAGCEVAVRPAGATVDLNAADEELLRGVFVALGISPMRADSVVAALLDWRDADDVPRPAGAERSWYQAEHRPAPRNGPLADIRELSHVRGLETLEGLEGVLGTEPGRISLDHAPPAVLAALPGFTEETVGRVIERRLRGLGIEDLLALSGELSPAARDALLARYPDLVRTTTTDPDAWIVTSRAGVGTPPLTASIEVRLVRAGSRAAIVRRRTMIQ